ETREFLRSGGRFDFAGLPDASATLERSRIEGATLETTEIRDVLAVADRAASWREIAFHPPSALRDGWPAIMTLSQGIADFSELLRFFRNKILPDGTLDDRASAELARLRREIDKQKRAIQESLRGYLRRLAEGGAVQDELVTIRGERFVIPVKIEHKRRVSGVVHGASSSGQTVFVEPMETIEQNNELVRLLEEELAEVHRILREMTARIGERADEIANASEILAELELQFAKARFAQDYNCVSPTIAADGETKRPALRLSQARHPLLERNLRGKSGTVVPLDLEFKDDACQVIISGPNTGGKTVALKTIGLLALMSQAGIPVPAERAELPVFDAVLADIGDYQSIEQNLSTFSAHVTNIDLISKTATRNSLVLLDELGSATDPEEGAALAVAIADRFRQIGCVSVISTHHTSLKVYAANTAAVVNAAVGFDERTLQPTYELRLGVPGASAGINIAAQLGLNAEIIGAARARLGSQTQDIARFLDKLHAELRELGAERLKLHAREQELQRERDKLEREGLREQRAKVQEMEKKLEAVLRDFEFRARETVSAVQERAAALKLGKEAERRIARLRREFKEQFDSTLVAHQSGADAGDPQARPGLVQNVSEGDTVRVKSLGRPGTIKRRLDENTFEVELGGGKMSMKIRRDDIAEVLSRAGDTPVQAARARGIKVAVTENETAASELNVIGENVDEATRRVERFVDRAFLAGLPRLRIVHGSGMGVLRKALRQYLQKHPHVASVAEPAQSEGGAGATVVELRL
ncbi:MAG TPA: Smr/MutS family protein, partial [Terriglobales bacterium]|nr:Smr/MutS family protein [Terriglobales bacterium]